ncbi:MAG: hypothetical protein WDO68_09640 [Gammaproteobacteria bacterium]
MTGPEYDAELEAFLKRRSPMHRRLSDIDHAEPSLELDRVVLNRAREAIETPASQPLFRPRWALPIGLAATILIAFTVVLNIDHHGIKAAAGKSVASNVSAAAEAAPQAPAVARGASARRPERVDRPQLLSDTTAERRDSKAQEKAPAPAAEAQVPALRNVAEASADSARLVASSDAARPLGAEAPLPASPPSPAATAPDPHASPDSWLREINRLRAAGQTADADRELTAFRQAYPTHPAYSVAKPPTR